MAYLCVDSLVDYLESLETEGNISFPLNDQIQGLKLELRFLSTFLRCTSLGLITDGAERLLDLLTRIDAFAEEAEMELLVIADKDLSCKVPVMLEAIKLIQSEIRRIFVKELESQTEVNNLPGYEIVLELVECVLGNLRALVDAEAKSIGPSKIQIEALQKSIGFLGSVVQFIANRCTDEYDILEDLLTHVLAVTQRAACLSYLCWVDELVDEEMAGGICVRLSDLLRKIKSTTNPEAREVLFAVLKVSKSPPPNIAMKEEFVISFIDSLLENLMELQDTENQAKLTVPLEFEIQNTLQELRFLKALIIDLPNQYDEPQELDNFLIRIESVVCEAGCLVYMICAIVQKENVAKEINFALHDFLEQIGRIKAEIRRIYLEKLHNNSPGNCDTLFIYPILSNLKDLLNNHNKSIDTAKQQIETLLRGLASLNSFFEKQGGLKEYCLRFIDAAYQADYVVNSFVSRGGPVWHHLLCTVLDEINLMNADLIETCTKKNIDSVVLKDLETSTDPLGKIYLAPSYLTNDAVDFNDGVVSLDDEARSPSYLRNTINFNDGAGLVLNDEANKIIDGLTRGSMQLDIVSIVGMAGAGKTFLAQKIYTDPLVYYHFHCRAWCCVSQEYRPRDLVLSILESITILRSDVYKMGNEDLFRLVYKYLKGSRFLIVMDDIWDVGAWNDIKVSIPADNNGSRILFTSRLFDVALEANPCGYIHSIRLLTADECLKLLELKLFHEERIPEHLLQIGRQIAKSCRGLPLAVVTIAGVLDRARFDEDSWKQVAESLNSSISGGYYETMKVLELSYRHLPYNLKLAFLYSGGILQDKGIFQDNVICVQKLIWLWIAEGFIQKTEEYKSLEDIGEEYLMQLIDRSLIMVAKRKPNGRVKECRVHDLLGEFCKMKAKEISCLEVIHGCDEFASFLASNKQRRLCIFSGRKDFTEWKLRSPYLSSLLFFSTEEEENMCLTKSYDVSFVCYNFKLLRVLDLGCINMGTSFPSGIELLLHLRYLAVKGQVNYVPSYIGNLQSLETFIMKGLRGEILLPETIWNLESLRHLHVSPRVAFSLLDYKSGKYHLVHLDTFSTPALSSGKDMKEIMRRLPNIRKLRCIFLESWDYFRKSNRFPVIDFLCQLESLKVSYHGAWRYPCEIGFPLNLKELTLSKFRLPWNEISAIGRLPNLEVLKLLTKSFDGQQWNMRVGEFLHLKFLKLAELNIVRWNASDDQLPNLRHLVLEKCKQLEAIPACFGDIPTLEIIDVKHCSISTSLSAREIQEMQFDMGNDQLKVSIQSPIEGDG